jgi:hypothetical protein
VAATSHCGFVLGASFSRCCRDGAGLGRQIVVSANASGTVFYPRVYWHVTMDVEFWKNCGFVSCPNAGSYYCKTSCQTGGFSSPTAFVAITQSGLCGTGIVLQAGGGQASTTIQDCGPTAGGGCSNPYWFNGNIPSIGGCMTDLLYQNLGLGNLGCTSSGCSNACVNGAPNVTKPAVYWRFAN